MRCVYSLRPLAMKSFVGFLFFYSAFLPLLSSRTCMAYYTPEYGSAFDAVTMSTHFTRLLTLSRACPSGQICHIYSSLPENPSTSIILNVHTGSDLDQIQVLYNKEEALDLKTFQSTAFNKTPKSYYLDIEWKAQRFIHSVYIDGLEPNTPYYVQFVADKKIPWRCSVHHSTK